MSMIDGIFEAGVVGCGGAGFPTHIKFSGKGIQHLILNGAECEPLLRTDRYIMKNKAKELIFAAEAIRLATGAKDCTIALKRTYIKEIEALEKAIDEAGVLIKLHLMDSFYPAGDEHVVVYEVLGTPVPPMGIPLDVGAVVSNVATVLAVKDALEGIAFTQKYLTITGRVKNPVILRVPVGTGFETCIRLAGGALDEDYVVISGGPMMGVPLTKEESQSAVVTKTTSGIIVVPTSSYLATHSKISLQHMKNRAAAACIQCNFCTQLCPRNLLGHPLEPHRIMRKMAAGGDFADMLEDPDIRGAALCCECGVCETYACPMELQPRRINALIKQELAKAGIRYQPKEGEYPPDSNRDYREVPTKRIAARAGVSQFYDYEIETLIENIPEKVTILLKQHAGLPAQPLVSQGERVAIGQMIGGCPQGKMGANIHASIDGIVTSVNESGITIERRE